MNHIDANESWVLTVADIFHARSMIGRTRIRLSPNQWQAALSAFPILSLRLPSLRQEQAISLYGGEILLELRPPDLKAIFVAEEIGAPA